MKEKFNELGWGSLIYIIIILFTLNSNYDFKLAGIDFLLLMVLGSLFSFVLYQTIRNNLKKKFKKEFISSILSGIFSWVITVIVVAQVLRF